MRSNNFNWPVVQTNGCADLLPGAARAKRRIATNERDLPLCCKSRANGNNVLFGNTGFDKAVGELLGKQTHLSTVGQICAHADDLVVLLASFEQSAPKAITDRFF